MITSTHLDSVNNTDVSLGRIFEYRELAANSTVLGNRLVLNFQGLRKLETCFKLSCVETQWFSPRVIISFFILTHSRQSNHSYNLNKVITNETMLWFPLSASSSCL